MNRLLPRAAVPALASLLVACTAPSEHVGTEVLAPARAAGAFWSHRVQLARDLPYGDDPQHRLDLYLQGTWIGEPTFFARAPEPRPTLLFIHGGGWVVADRRVEPWVYPFLERGWHVVSITYRLGPGTAPAAVDDAICALAWLVEHANESGFDLHRVVVAGASAGGHLALTTAALASRPGHDCYPGDDFRIASVVNWFGITDIGAVAEYLDTQDHWFGNYARSWIGDDSRLVEISAAYSPVQLLDAASPPVLTIHGTDDTVVPYQQALALHARLDELRVRNELLSLQGGTHAGFTDAQFQAAFRKIFEFLDPERS